MDGDDVRAVSRLLPEALPVRAVTSPIDDRVLGSVDDECQFVPSGERLSFAEMLHAARETLRYNGEPCYATRFYATKHECSPESCGHERISPYTRGPVDLPDFATTCSIAYDKHEMRCIATGPHSDHCAIDPTDATQPLSARKLVYWSGK